MEDLWDARVRLRAVGMVNTRLCKASSTGSCLVSGAIDLTEFY